MENLPYAGWMQNGVHILCNWNHGFQRKPIHRRYIGTVSACFSHYTNQECCIHGISNAKFSLKNRFSLADPDILSEGNIHILNCHDALQGMGEPMNNYDAVVKAVKVMTGRCFRLSPKHITLSTVWATP